MHLLSVSDSIKSKGLFVELAQRSFLRELSEIDKHSPLLKKISNPKKILFNRVYANYAQAFLNEVAIAKSLQLLGHDVKFLLCGKVMNDCTAMSTILNIPDKRKCENCYKFGKMVLDTVGIPYSFFSDNDSEEVPYSIEQHADDSINRFFLGAVHPEDTIFFDIVKTERRHNTRVSYHTAEREYKEFKPDILITTHGCYAEWGPFTDYMKEKWVKTFIWDYSFGNAMVFNLDTLQDDYRRWKLKHESLSNEENEQLDNYLEKRKKGQANTKYYQFKQQKLERPIGYEGIYAMFTNLPWDTSLTTANNIYSNIYDWIDDTINFFTNHKEFFLYIKVHPAEKYGNGDRSYQTVADYIDAYFDLPDNIKVIDADDKINPYMLHDIIDVGIVYNGTSGLEMATRSIPTIVTGNIHYKGHGFTFEPNTIEEYRELLLDDSLMVTHQQAESARHYSYFYYFIERYPIDYLKHTITGMKYQFKTFDELLKNKDMKRILSKVLEE